MMKLLSSKSDFSHVSIAQVDAPWTPKSFIGKTPQVLHQWRCACICACAFSMHLQLYCLLCSTLGNKLVALRMHLCRSSSRRFLPSLSRAPASPAMVALTQVKKKTIQKRQCFFLTKGREWGGHTAILVRKVKTEILVKRRGEAAR